MDAGTYYLFNLALIFLLVMLNGVFVAAEFASVRSHLTKLKETELEGTFGVSSAVRVIETLNQSLSACQLGITIASLMLGWLGEAVIADLVVLALGPFGYSAQYLAEHQLTVVVHGVATAVALFFITVLHVVLGEMAAKAIAISYPETTLRYLAPLLLLFDALFRPFIVGLNSSANYVLTLFGLQPVDEGERVHSSSELSMLIEQSTEHGELDKSEEQIIKSVFTFAETVAREIMTPRPDVIAIPGTATFDEAVKVVADSGLSRFPVLGDSGIDDIIGVVLARDLLGYLARASNRENFTLKSIMREAYFVPGTKGIDDLLNELKRRQVHLAVVLDEHGGVDGVVTLEDILEELVGEIFDESDRPDESFRTDAAGDIILDAGLHVADVNDRFQLKLPEGDGEYDTLAGFIFSVLGRTAREGDEVLVSDLGAYTKGSTPPHESGSLNGVTEVPVTRARITVEELSGNRIETVRLHYIPTPSDEKPDVQPTESG